MELRKIVSRLSFDFDKKEFIKDEGYEVIYKILSHLGLLANNGPSDPCYYKNTEEGIFWKFTNFENEEIILEEVTQQLLR